MGPVLPRPPTTRPEPIPPMFPTATTSETGPDAPKNDRRRTGNRPPLRHTAIRAIIRGMTQRANELEFVAWLRRTQRSHPALLCGIGDDMAIVNGPGGPILVASDMLLDGVHFDTTRDDLTDIGRKAAACALSDCAAMAVRPTAITVSLALPAAGPIADARRLFDGIAAMAAAYATAVAGGDTTTWNGKLAIDIAVVACPYPDIRPVMRSGARAGDGLYVTGRLGGSRLGRHLRFTPRVREARLLAAALAGRLHAMMDISDGVALDLRRLCDASDLGAMVDESLLERVASDDAHRSARRSGRPTLEHVLGDGEDFELLLAVSPDIADAAGVSTDGDTCDVATKGDPDTTKLYRIGSITDAGLSLRRVSGAIEPLPPLGYVHR